MIPALAIASVITIFGGLIWVWRKTAPPKQK
jgi:hypothetical protein